MLDVARRPETYSHLNAVLQAAIVIDSSCRLVFANELAVEFFGWRTPEVIGMRLIDLMTPCGDEALLGLFGQPGEPQEIDLTTAEGLSRRVEVSAHPTYSASGDFDGAIIIAAAGPDAIRRALLMNAAAQTADILASHGNFGEAVEEALKLIADTSDADRVYLYEKKGLAENAFLRTYAWSADGSHGLTTSVDLDTIPGDWIREWMPQLESGNVVARSVSDAPSAIRCAMRAIGIQSFLIVPITVDDELRGALVLNDCRRQRSWGQCEITALSTVARMFAGAIRIATSERRFRTLVSSDSQIVWIADENGMITELSGAWCDLTGMTAEECKGNGWQRAIHPRDAARVLPSWEQRIQTKKPCLTQYRVRAADGTYKWFSVSAVPVFDALGRFVEWVGESTNIDEEKRAKESLRERQEELAKSERTARELAATLIEKELTYRSIFDHSLDGIMLTSPDGSVLAANPAMCDMLGYSEEEIKTLGRAGLVDEEDGSIRAALAQRAESGHFRGELVISRRNGPPLPVEVSTAVFETADGQKRTSMFVRDITEAKRNREELIAAKEEAEQMAALKSTFLSNMSHEIRTPLTSVIGFSDVLLDGYDGDVREVLRIIRSAGHRLLETLESVLDLSQIESGVLELACSPLDVNAIVRETVEMFEARAIEKGIEMRTRLPDQPVIAHLDRGAVSRVLGNLISNAVKFTDKGIVEVELASTQDAVIMSVTDTGLGISEDFVPHLFKPFQQESSGLARSHEGSGLGLSITQQLVALLNGTISLESKKGKGSTFTVRLPATPR